LGKLSSIKDIHHVAPPEDDACRSLLDAGASARIS
jgi:hypothetical protein